MTKSVFGWSTVRALNPLRIRPDVDPGDTLDITPDCLTPPSELSIGQRVWTQFHGRRVVVWGNKLEDLVRSLVFYPDKTGEVFITGLGGFDPLLVGFWEFYDTAACWVADNIFLFCFDAYWWKGYPGPPYPEWEEEMLGWAAVAVEVNPDNSLSFGNPWTAELFPGQVAQERPDTMCTFGDGGHVALIHKALFDGAGEGLIRVMHVDTDTLGVTFVTDHYWDASPPAESYILGISELWNNYPGVVVGHGWHQDESGDTPVLLSATPTTMTVTPLSEYMFGSILHNGFLYALVGTHGGNADSSPPFGIMYAPIAPSGVPSAAWLTEPQPLVTDHFNGAEVYLAVVGDTLVLAGGVYGDYDDDGAPVEIYAGPLGIDGVPGQLEPVYTVNAVLNQSWLSGPDTHALRMWSDTEVLLSSVGPVPSNAVRVHLIDVITGTLTELYDLPGGTSYYDDWPYAGSGLMTNGDGVWLSWYGGYLGPGEPPIADRWDIMITPGRDVWT